MKPTVYLETSVVSYLAANPNRDLIVAAHQQITHEWWENQRANFELTVSPFVTIESQRGDSKTAAKRMNYLAGLRILEASTEVLELAKTYCQRTGPTSFGEGQ